MLASALELESVQKSGVGAQFVGGNTEWPVINFLGAGGWQLCQTADVRNGHVEVLHERLLIGVELDHRKAAGRDRLQCV